MLQYKYLPASSGRASTPRQGDFCVMQTTTAKKPFYYGWVVVLGCSIVIGASTGLITNCAGIFIKPVTESLNVSRGAFTLYNTMSSIASICTIMLWGELFRRYPARKLMLLGSLILSACIFGYSFATKLWHFYVIGALYGCFSTTTAGLGIATVINNWFLSRKALATGLAWAGCGVSAAIMTPIATRVVELYGWRMGYRLMAGTGLFLYLTAILFFIRESPAQRGLLPLGAEQSAEGLKTWQPTGLTRAQTVKTPAYWAFTLGLTLVSFIGMGMTPHIIAYLTDIGYSSSTASSVQAAVMWALVLAEVVLGAVFDRVGPVYTSLLTGLSLLLSVLLLLFTGSSPLMPWLFAFVYGFGYATLSVPIAYLVGENFGTREFSAVYSLCTMPSGIGGALGSPFSGMVFDTTGGYLTVWLIYLALSVVCTLALTFAAARCAREGYKYR